MSCLIELSETARSALASLNSLVRERIVRKLETVKSNPFVYVKRLAGVELYSLRVGDYRAIMRIDEAAGIILIMRVGHRKNIHSEI